MPLVIFADISETLLVVFGGPASAVRGQASRNPTIAIRYSADAD